MGAFASGVRDLMLALGFGAATLVGHSLGGGAAMQFAYQLPERTERRALISSGGLGADVHLLLRYQPDPLPSSLGDTAIHGNRPVRGKTT